MYIHSVMVQSAKQQHLGFAQSKVGANQTLASLNLTLMKCENII